MTPPPTWQELLSFISGAGFATFVAVFLLVRVDGTLKNLIIAIQRLTDRMNDQGH